MTKHEPRLLLWTPFLNARIMKIDPCLYHVYITEPSRSVPGQHSQYCRNCGIERGLVLISAVTFSMAMTQAKEIKLPPTSWKYIVDTPYLRRSNNTIEKREERIMNYSHQIDSESDLVGYFSEEEVLVLLK